MSGATNDGQPYFVMELVEGSPLTEFCDQWRLTIEERLELFIPVCLAVQHAHQRGIIHRDLKTGNVLVSQVDGKPVPKVIDFGLASAFENHGRANGQTECTAFNQVLGTLQYLSPEQAGLDVVEADIRSDIYSLGAMLYELITGTTPIEREVIRRQSLWQTLDSIRETGNPSPQCQGRVVAGRWLRRRPAATSGARPAQQLPPQRPRLDLDAGPGQGSGPPISDVAGIDQGSAAIPDPSADRSTTSVAGLSSPETRLQEQISDHHGFARDCLTQCGSAGNELANVSRLKRNASPSRIQQRQTRVSSKRGKSLIGT